MFPQTLNLGNPVNRSHPLNRGRVAWWLAVPGWAAGQSFRDLAGLNPGNLTSMANANNGWRPSSRPGGNADVLFDGSAGYIEVPSASVLLNSVSTWSFWFKTSQSVGSYIWLAGIANSSNTNSGWNIVLTQTTGVILAQIKDSGGSGPNLTGGSALNDGTWHQIALVLNGASNVATLYVDGQTTATGSPSGTWSVASDPLRLGKSQDTFWGLFAGRMDNISSWSRALSAAEVQQDYDLSRRFYPGALNYIPAQPFGVQAAAGATYAWWARQQGGILGSGAAA